MTAGFWVRTNEAWLPLDGVQAGVPVRSDRQVSELKVLGGRRYVSRSKRAAREWSLDLTNATPEAIRLLALAANGQAGEVMMLDVSAARANMLDPLETVGPVDYPLLDCGGLPLRSLSVGGPLTKVVEVAASANVTLNSTGTKNISVGISATMQPLVRFGIPAFVGATLTSAQLLLARIPFGPSMTVDVRQSANDWIEDRVPVPAATWATAPAVGASMGSGADTANEYSISLAGVAAYMGSALSVRLRRLSGSSESYMYARDTLGGPRLRLTYALPAPTNPTFSATMRGGQAYTLTGFTDAASGAQILTYTYRTLGGLLLSAAVNAPAGTGPRPFTGGFTPAADTIFAGVVTASTAGKVAGLRLVEGAATGVWVPGQKTPCRVSVVDPEQTLNFLLDGQQGRSDYRITVKEVG